MLQVKKDYHSLLQLSSAWGLDEPDVRYVVENGYLRPSVRLFGVFPEYELPEPAAFPEDDDPPTWLGDRRVDGPMNLYRSDIAAILHNGGIQLRQVPTENHCALLFDAHQVITVRLSDLVVPEDERRRFETEELPRKLQLTKLPCFSNIEIGGKRYTFPANPASALQWLYERALEDDRWYSPKKVCDAIPSSATKLSEVFKRHPESGDLIEKGRPGQCRFFPDKARELAGRATPTG